MTMKNIVALILFAGCACLHGQNIKGKVEDEKGQPVPFAAVTIQNVGRTVNSSIDGSFEVRNVAAGANVLRIHAFGFLEKIDTVIVSPDDNGSNTQSLQIRLKQSSQQLDEVVV